MYTANAVQLGLTTHMVRNNITEIWRSKEELGRYWKLESQLTYLAPMSDGRVTDKRPVICAVYNSFYQAYCMKRSMYDYEFFQAVGQPACSKCIPINEIYWTAFDNAACYGKPHPHNETECTCRQFDCMPRPCNSSLDYANLPERLNFTQQDSGMTNLSFSDMPVQ